MSRVKNAAEAIAQAAGWKQPRPGEDGRFRFSLEEGLDMEMFSPDGSTCIMRGIVASLPAEGPEAETALAEYAKRAVGRARTGKTVLTVEEGRTVLFRDMRLDKLTPEEVVREARDFLNDFAWWRGRVQAATGTPRTGAPSGAFAPGAGWMPVR